MSAALHIGTSGWHYAHWRGPFYPEMLPASKMLPFYFGQFDTVELNNTFYRLPTAKALEAWREQTPPHFLFAVKGSRFLTHMKKLKDAEAGIEKFMDCVEILGKKLGPILFQLPPRWESNPDRLDEFLGLLPRRHCYGFELRDPSWHNQQVYQVLRRHRAAFCIYDLAGFQSGVEITTDFTYVRLHGPGGRYQGLYSPGALEDWATRIRGWARKLKAIYVYFDNDQAGFAAQNARDLRKLV